MGKQSKQELETQFRERWEVKIFNLFKNKQKREEQEKSEVESYIQYIYEFTEINGVRETARRLEENGRKTNATAISQIRNGITEDYGFDYIAGLAEAISNLGVTESEKKPE